MGRLGPATKATELISGDRAGYRFVARYGNPEPVDHLVPLTISVIAGGRVRQSITVTVSPVIPGSPPELRNLADDGRDQLVVPVDSGSGGVVYTIFRATDAAPDFVDTGDVQGLDEATVTGLGVQRTADGYVAAMAKSGPAEHYLRFWHFVGERLRLVAQLRLTYRANLPTPSCEADDEGDGHGDSGLSDAEVAQRFCGEKTYPATPVR